MGQPEPPPLGAEDIYRLMQHAFDQRTTEGGSAQGLIAAHVTSTLLLAERLGEMTDVLSELRQEVRQSRLDRRAMWLSSNGSAAGSDASSTPVSPGGSS